MQGDTGSPIDEEAFAAFGIPIPQDRHERCVEVWPENAPVVKCFLAMDTQWTRSPMTGRIEGMRYESMQSIFRFCEVRRRHQAAVFFGLRVMEHAALECLRV